MCATAHWGLPGTKGVLAFGRCIYSVVYKPTFHLEDWKIIIIQHLVNLGADGDAGHAIDCCRCMASLSLQLKVPQSAGALKPSSTEWTCRMEKEVASTACLGSRFRRNSQLDMGQVSGFHILKLDGSG